MKKWIGVLVVSFAITGSPGQAQTVYGPGGLFVHPTAFTRPQGTTGLNVSYFTQEDNTGRSSSWLPVSLTFAPDYNTEIGALYVNRHARGDNKSSGGVFGKYQFSPDTPKMPALAISGSFLDGDIEQSSLALVGSHSFLQGDRVGFTGHLGVQWARRGDIPDPEDDFSVFVGAGVPLAPNWTLVGEYGTKFDFDLKASSAIGVLWNAPNGGSVGIGFVNTGRSRENEFFIGVGYPLGGRR